MRHGPDMAVVVASIDSAHELQEHLRTQGISARLAHGDDWCAFAVTTKLDRSALSELRALPSVAGVSCVSSSYLLTSLEALKKRRAVRLGRFHVGGEAPILPVVVGGARGPASAEEVRAAGGVVWLAGSVEQDATAPFGVPLDTLPCLARSTKAGPVLGVSVSDAADPPRLGDSVVLVQVNANDMQNFGLLRALGELSTPVILQRGRAATVEELLLAAEYIAAGGNGRIILSEPWRAARPSAWAPHVELNIVALLRTLTHLPVIVDLADASADATVVGTLVRAGIAAGADGACVKLASSEASGGLSAAECARIFQDAAGTAKAVGRGLARLPEPEFRSKPAPDPVPTGPHGPMEVLQITEGNLSAVISEVLGHAPTLRVLGQQRISPPYPPWLSLLLRPQGDLLLRWTSYVSGSEILTRNAAYVDFGRVDPAILRDLQEERLNLGELFLSQTVDRFGYAFGTGADAGPLDDVLRAGHPSRTLHPYVWRRYVASTAGRVGFLVIESLPVLTWERLLAARRTAGAQ